MWFEEEVVNNKWFDWLEVFLMFFFVDVIVFWGLDFVLMGEVFFNDIVFFNFDNESSWVFIL